MSFKISKTWQWIVGSVIAILAIILPFIWNSKSKPSKSQGQSSNAQIHAKDSSKVNLNSPNIQQQNEVKGNQNNEIIGRDKTVTNVFNKTDTKPNIKIENLKNLNTAPGGRAGDDYYITERQLTVKDKAFILGKILENEEKNNTKAESFRIFQTQGSNAGQFVSQLIDFLQSQGLKFDGRVLWFIQGVKKDITVGMGGTQINIGIDNLE